MSRGDAFGQEMQVLRELTEGDQELTSFLQEMRATLVAPPAGAVATALPARLAAEARAAAPTTNGHPAANGRPRGALSRPLLRIALALAAIPLLFTGLAVAGVNLPGPAKDAFESIGIDLPNQAGDDRAEPPARDGDSAGTAHDGDSAGSQTGQSNSAGKLGDGNAKQNPARAEGVPGDGRAIGQEQPVPAGGDAQGDGVRDVGGDDVGGGGGNATGKPESPPVGAPPEPPGPPESPGSQGKPPGGVLQKGSSGSGGGPPGG